MEVGLAACCEKLKIKKKGPSFSGNDGWLILSPDFNTIPGHIWAESAP